MSHQKDKGQNSSLKSNKIHEKSNEQIQHDELSHQGNDQRESSCCETGESNPDKLNEDILSDEHQADKNTTVLTLITLIFCFSPLRVSFCFH